MGANQSLEEDANIHNNGGLPASGAHNSKNLHQHNQQTIISSETGKKAGVSGNGAKRQKAKPGPPYKPRIVEVTNSSIMLSWQPPRTNNFGAINHQRSHYDYGFNSSATIIAYTVEIMRLSSNEKGKKSSPKGDTDNSSSSGKKASQYSSGHWTVMTKTCQTTSYCARNLDPDVTYTFRIRAENLCGTGKPSVPSDPGRTSLYESTSDECFFPSNSYGNNGHYGVPSSPPPTPTSLKFDFDSHSRSKEIHETSNGSPDHMTDYTSVDGAAPQRLRRRHSFNIHLDGGAVNKIVNHNSDLVLNNGVGNNILTTSCMSQSQSCHAALSPDANSYRGVQSSTHQPLHRAVGFLNSKHRLSERRTASTATTRTSYSLGGVQDNPVIQGRNPNKNMNSSPSHSTDPLCESSSSSPASSLCRKTSRTSRSSREGVACSGACQSQTAANQSRKISLPILLPGTGTESLSRLRESRTSLRSSVSGVQGEGQARVKGKRSRDVMVVTVGDDKLSTSSSRSLQRRPSTGSGCSDASCNGCQKVRSSNSSSSTNISVNNNSNNTSPADKRDSRTSMGSAESDLTSSGFSGYNVEGSSASSESARTSMVSSSTSSSGFTSGPDSVELSVSLLPGLSRKSSRSDATLSNSKCGSRDSLYDIGALSACSNSSSVGDLDNRVDFNNSGKMCFMTRSNETILCNENFEDSSYSRLNNDSNNNNRVDEECNTRLFNYDTDDDIYKLKQRLKSLEITDENLRNCDLNSCFDFHDNDTDVGKDISDGSHIIRDGKGKGSYYASLENPWEKDTNTNGVSERILEAPFCDDVKMALYARETNDYSAFPVSAAETVSRNNPENTSPRQSSANIGDAGDFRTLRSVLQSNNMFVKAQRFAPDVVGVVVGEMGNSCRTLTRALLTTIDDAEEDEETAVRITTL